MVRDFFVSLFLFIFFSFNLYSSGFRLSEQSSKANGMGNAMTAIADDASVVWYNPAGMSFLKGNLVSLGTVMIYPSMKHNYNGGEDEISKVLHIPPYFLEFIK
ncbi:MAG TPA: outer membrane protein transport protein [Elusimicrobiales bacterium]|nr:outer membrane protein transport protein [Elusimicrobiales bacterium]HOL63044.1 outer membrane protein transport protein [Elusimicrobiales bacterium]HPO95347.1 outer membrane protein transport protein [Elusimicrobiales bacterium]